ncbi:GTPase domain-containing protein [Billgrantia endophytica]|uniref:G domain-containing protein n=1 Tax=Billgrantia endophytica TaxID=2033802 RepID=A0A2N7UC03_9GAMM|nr:GTPase domain-containing protein [Halomonas endophytica]PMR77940.1 hypothetical protein C1H69_01125 [Halomonas endophytica]
MKEKIIVGILVAIAKPAFDLFVNVGKWGIDQAKQAPGAVKDLVKWWNGKTIAVIGATASGKNSFYDCLLEKDPPKEHISTRGAEKVDSFTVRRNIQGLETIELRCKRSVNVGGEVDERIRFWSQACSDADFIFYLVDMERLNDPDIHDTYHLRIGDDLKWLGANLSKFKEGCKVHLLLNKIDKILEIPSLVDNRREFIENELNRHIAEMESRAKSILDRNSSALSGASPMCMVDKDLFNFLFDGVLASIYSQEHPE